MATKVFETINGVNWEVITISQGETINQIKENWGTEPWMKCFVPSEPLYNMTFYFEPISGDFKINGTIDGGPVEVIGNINNTI